MLEFQFLDLDTRFMGVGSLWKFIKLYIYDACAFLSVCCNSVSFTGLISISKL